MQEQLETDVNVVVDDVVVRMESRTNELCAIFFGSRLLQGLSSVGGTLVHLGPIDEFQT